MKKINQEQMLDEEIDNTIRCVDAESFGGYVRLRLALEHSILAVLGKDAAKSIGAMTFVITPSEAQIGKEVLHTVMSTLISLKGAGANIDKKQGKEAD